jgi:hypothetical protein
MHNRDFPSSVGEVITYMARPDEFSKSWKKDDFTMARKLVLW